MRRLALLVLLAVTACDKASPSAPATPPVLPRIEAFKPPPTAGEEDVYDRITKSLQLKAATIAAGQDPPAWLQDLKPLPPTLTDTLLEDFRSLSFYDLGVRLDASTVTVAQTQAVIDHYVKTDAYHLRGYRPYTHKKFMASLSPDERTQLATEAVTYLKANGFKGVDQLPKGDPPKPKPAAGEPAAAASAPSPSASADGDTVYAGTYSTTFGRLVFVQAQATPNQLTGKYSKGKIACTVAGANLDCTWNEGGASVGRAVFARQPNGDLRGSWGMGQSATKGGKWVMKLQERSAMN